MKTLKVLGLAVLVSSLYTSQAFAATASSARDIIWQGLMGAGVGAISADVSGGKAGKGALIGAGTNVIGTALIGHLTQPSAGNSDYYEPSYSQPTYSQPTYTQPTYYQPQYQTQTTYVPVRQRVVVQQPVVYRQPEPVYVQPQPAYSYAPVYEDPNRRIIKQGLMGAGVGAISSYASGGKAGSGALIGAGTNVIGGALLELLTQ